MLCLDRLRGRLESLQLGPEAFERLFPVFSPDAFEEVFLSPAIAPAVFEHLAAIGGAQVIDGAAKLTTGYLASESHHPFQAFAEGAGGADEPSIFLAVRLPLLLLVPVPVVLLALGGRRHRYVILDVLDAPFRTVLGVDDPELLADLRDQLLEECLDLVDPCAYLAIGVFDSTISQVVVHPPAEATKSFDDFEVFQFCLRLLFEFQPATSFLYFRVLVSYQKIPSMSRVFNHFVDLVAVDGFEPSTSAL